MKTYQSLQYTFLFPKIVFFYGFKRTCVYNNGMSLIIMTVFHIKFGQCFCSGVTALAVSAVG